MATTKTRKTATKPTKTAVMSFDLPETRTIPVDIAGKRYEVAAGAVGAAIELPGMMEAWQDLADGAATPAELRDHLVELQERTEAFTAALFGAEGAAELVGGPNAYNVPRILAVLGIAQAVMSSDDNARAIEDAASAIETDDVD